MQTLNTAVSGVKSKRSLRAAAVRAVEGRIADALEPLGFKRVRGGISLKLVKQVDSDFEIFLFPGVQRRAGKIVVYPTIGLICIPLQQKLEALDDGPTTHVCVTSLGSIDTSNLWIELELLGEHIGDDGLAIIIDTVERAALPLLTSLCSIEQVRKLFEDAVEGPRIRKVGVIQERQKLAALNELILQQQSGKTPG